MLCLSQKERNNGMDNKKFGMFIAEQRKEKGWTQAELAKKINVTDKAISRWERGLGFPDINTIEPLADALGLSIVEVMQSEKISGQEIKKRDANEAVSSVIDVAQYMRKLERRNIFVGVIIPAVIVLLIFLLDNMPLEGFMFACLPLVFLIGGVVLIVMSIYQKKQGRSHGVTLLLGILMLLYPVAIILLLCLVFPLGALGMA